MADEGSAFPIEHERMLATLLDVVVPPSEDGRLPGAGALGLTDHVLRTVEQTPMLGPVMVYGLSALADLAATRNRGGWDGLSPDERADVLREFTTTDQFFLPAFLFLAYSGYYQHPRVIEALGLEARAPHPVGYEMDSGDFSLLDVVRRRGPIRRRD